MTITYRVDDGYAGGDAPHRVNVPDSEIAECECLEDAEVLIDDAVRGHFLEHIRPYFDIGEYAAPIEVLIRKRQEEDATTP